MATAWTLTLPAAGLIGALAHEGVQVFPSDTSGVVAVGIAGLAIAGTFFELARRSDHVTARNVLDSLPPRPPPPAPVSVGAAA
jgi:hypothetical protein